MWRTNRITQRILLAVLLVTFGSIDFAPVQADTTAVPSLTISQLKITSSNGQFVTLYNPTNGTLNMSNYQLEYFNSFDLSKATSRKLIALSGVLPPHGYYMINDGALQLCYQMTVDSISLGFSIGAGLVEVMEVNQVSPGAAVVSTVQDYVGWSKTAVAGVQTIPADTSAFLQRQPLDTQNNPQVLNAGDGTWQPVQPDASQPCNLLGASMNSGMVGDGANKLLLPSQPPVIFVSADAMPADVPSSLPTSDIGLMAPQITELLPNPTGTGSDKTDEYIELYNSNDVAFDLTGFTLRTGSTTTHSYTFNEGHILAPHSFTSFYTSLTKLTLSNSGGQATLLDPSGTILSSTDTYGTAADGQAWALANGAWYWTTQSSPGAANVINQPTVKSPKSAVKQLSGKATASTTKSASKLRSGKSKAATSKSAAKKKKLNTTTTAARATITPKPTSIPIHPWELASVGSIALLYAVYEYRKDLANQLRKFVANTANRFAPWAKFAWWRSDRTGE